MQHAGPGPGGARQQVSAILCVCVMAKPIVARRATHPGQTTARTSHECKHLLKERELSDKQEEIALTAKRIERDQDAPKDKRGVNTQLDILEDAGRSMERATECLSSSKVLAIKPGADKNKLSSDDLVGVPFEDTGDGRRSCG